ncbi:hypothetical protein COV20_01985 [Candidatus Woesearchaeota archaeon CG10_big_fil_rev_8_21_14_0_10_45_16]|nr:MAG: hypothetical protein COV20_01985 [Candidatus Woesearchaeota archaeon CG10_big_fil_rev_8_21_14_0_10_45_16]
MEMTPLEEKLFREKVIREYKLQQKRQEPKGKPTNMDILREGLKKILPLNLAIGIIAIAAMIYLSGWDNFLHLLISGIIWITIISTLMSTYLNKKR